MSRELRDLLGRAAGPVASSADVDAAWRRGRSARRRRQATRAVGSLVALAALVTGGVALLGGGGNGAPDVVTGPSTSACAVTKPTPDRDVPADVLRWAGDAPPIGVPPKTGRVVGHDDLWALAPRSSTFAAFDATRNGFILKFPWYRRGDGTLSVSARPAVGGKTVTSDVNEAIGPGGVGFQTSAPVLPEPGCWDVTGRVGATRVTVRVNVVPQYNEARDASGHWTEVPLAAAGFGPDAHEIDAVIAGGPGFIAGGMRYRPAQSVLEPTRATIWTSRDGVAWKRASLGRLDAARGQHVVALGSGPRGLLAIIADDGVGLVFRSTDRGRTWKQVRRATSLLPGMDGRNAAGGGAVAVRGIVGLHDGWLAYGAAPDVTFTPGVWFSRDGARWQRVLRGGSGEVSALVRVRDGYRAFGLDEGNAPTGIASWQSQNGRDWRWVGQLAGPARWLQSAAAAPAGGVIAIVSDQAPGPPPGPNPVPPVYALRQLSRDGRSWVPMPQPLPVALGDVVAGARGWMLAGARTDAPGNPMADAWVARDGVTWQEMPDAMPRTPGVLDLVATDGRTAIFASQAPEMPVLYVWRAP